MSQITVIYTSPEDKKHEQEMLEGLDWSQWDTWLTEQDIEPMEKDED